jgi:hypothetical protein
MTLVKRALPHCCLAIAAALPACSAEHDPAAATSGAASASASSGGGAGAGAGGSISVGAGTGGKGCGVICSEDGTQVVDCEGGVVETCSPPLACDGVLGTCGEACQAAQHNESSIGCEYYATLMDGYSASVCFAAFVANTFAEPAHITVERGGVQLAVGDFARIPVGAGPGLTYQPYDAAAGLPPGKVAILFLSGPDPTAPGDGSDVVPCPVAPALADGGMLVGLTGVGESFRISVDVPVVAYQMNPYGGGSAAQTGASLLLPTSAWGTNYVAVNAWETLPDTDKYASMNIVAREDDTTVTMLPKVSVIGGGGVPGAAAKQPFSFKLLRGQHAQISQQQSLTGSILSADKPIGFMAGHRCTYLPFDQGPCDHLEQMIPPVRALGHEYVGVMHRQRANEPAVWRVVGTVDGTHLSWNPTVGGPLTLGRGEVGEFVTDRPFVVKSQDGDHPIMLLSYMTGSSPFQGAGDPDFVIGVPPDQYLSRYVFFTDPTYPETNLVVVRRAKDGVFHDVQLDCLGALSGWQAVGDYQWTRVDLSTGNFVGVGGCSTGAREMHSDAPFGLWVWGWGTHATGDPLVGTYTMAVSYGYPGGMNARRINEVFVPPVAK